MRNYLPAPPNPPLPPAEPEFDPLSSAEEEAAPMSGIPVQRFLWFLLKYWWAPLVTMALALVAAGTYVWLGPPTYVSTGVMWETEQLRLGDMGFQQDLGSFFGTEAELLKSPTMINKAGEILRSAITNAPLAAGGDTASRIKVQVTQVPKSTVFDVVATGPEPAYTQAFLETLMNEYIAYKRNVHKEVAGGAEASITTQVNSYESEVQAAERALSQFKSTNDMAVLEEEAKGAGSYLASLKSRLSELELERKILEATALERSVRQASLTNRAPGILDYLNGLTPGTAGAMPAQRFDAIRELEMLKGERDRLSHNLRPKHPKMLRLNTEIEKYDNLVDIFRRQNEEETAAFQKSIQMKTDDVLASIKECEARVTLASGQLAQAEKLRQAAESARAVYDQTRSVLHHAEIGGSVAQETLQILQHAGPAIHSHREEVLALGLAALAGLALGLGIVFVVAIRDDRFNSLEEVKQQLQERVVGQVPEVSATGGNGHVPLIEIEDQRQTYAESYRNLRSAILFLTPVQNERPKVLLVTSATQEEGKSTIAANLARTLAMGGSQVLLIDADLRRGSLHETLGMERLPGLAEVLRHPTLLAKAIQSTTGRRRGAPRRTETSDPGNAPQPGPTRSTSLPNLSFMARGGDVNNPGDLLLSPALDQILARLRKQFDYILIDSCPVFAADDVTTLAPKVDGTMLVVRSRFSRFAQVREALQLLYQRQAKVLGVVFNRTDARARSYYYYTNSRYYVPASAPS
jgi:Mrp family chromosome partitioning ATPase